MKKAKKQKRQTFKGILKKRLIKTFLISTVVMFILTIIGSQFLLFYLNTYFYTRQSYSDRSNYDTINQLEEKEMDPSSPEGRALILNRVRIYSDSMGYIASGVIDGTTGEILWDGSTAATIVIKISDNLYTFSSEGELPDDFLKEYYKIQELSLSGDPDLYNSSININSIYVKNYQFVMGEITTHIYDKNGKHTEKTYDYTPDNIQGYTCIKASSDTKITGPIITGIPSDSDLYQEMQNYLETVKKDLASSDTYSCEWFGLFEMEIYSHSGLTLPNGDVYYIYHLMHINIIKSFGLYILIAYMIIYAIAMLIAFLTARIKYLKLKVAYDMEDFRITMTNTMAHDLKSPLMVISGFAENLKENINTEKKDYYSQEILDNVNYMNNIIADVLELSKIETGNITLKEDTFSAGHLIEDITSKYEDLLNEKQISVNTSGDKTIIADQTLMTRAFDNILSNAVKYGKDKSVVDITISGKCITFTNLCNTEVGDNVSQLWKPFVKGDNSRSNRQGTGVGLSIVKNILDLQGYKMELSWEDNKFTVRILL